MLRFGFFAGFRSFTGRERLRYTLAIHEGRSNEPEKPPNPHAHLIWSDRGHDGIERTASTWFKRYNGKAPERGGARKSREGRDREWLAGVVAMLHDVLEDADEEALAPVASWLSDEEAEALRLLTRERGSYDEYVERIATAGNRIAVLVKRREGAGLWPQPLSGSGYAQTRYLPGGKGLNNGFQISENAGSHPIHDL